MKTRHAVVVGSFVAAALTIASLNFSVAHADNGTVTVTPIGGVVNAGDPITVSVSPQAGNCVGALSVEAHNKANPAWAKTGPVAADGSFSIDVGSIVAPGPQSTVIVTCHWYGYSWDFMDAYVTVNPFPRAVVPMPVVYFASWLTVTGSGFLPGESVNLKLYSTEVNIGDQPADGLGNVTFSFALPPTIEIGNQHHALLTGSVSGKAQLVEFAVIPRSSGTTPSTPRMPSLGSDVA